MCSGNEPKLVHRGDAYVAARNGDTGAYDRANGFDGDLYRKRMRMIGPKVDPLARLGIFSTPDSKDAGADSMRHDPKTPSYGAPAPNPYLPKVG